MLLFIGLAMIFLPITGWTQLGYYDLPRYQTLFGVSLTQSEYGLYNINKGHIRSGRIRSFISSIDYGYTSDVKISFSPGISFISTDADIDIPPSPYLGVGIMNIIKFPHTNLHYFIKGSSGVTYAQATGQIHSNRNETYHSIGVSVSGSIGVFHRMNTESDMNFTPFFVVNYSNIWINRSTIREIYSDSTEQVATGNAGLEMQMTDRISLLGQWNFSFMESDGTFTIAIIFH